jgi:DNA-binding GntR family transcriptional regulator
MTTMQSILESDSGLAQRAYLTMLERILRGDFAIGQVISRRRIAADLGMSFLPASEALLRLQCDGLLESRPRAGTRIRIPTRQDLQGHFIVREALEVQAAIIFAGQSTREERAELIELASRLDAWTGTRSADPHTYLARHEELHQKIAEYTRCAALDEAIRKQSALASTWLGAIKTVIPPGAYPTHAPLLKALARKKPPEAGEAMRAHLQLEMGYALLILEPYFESNKKYSQTYTRTVRRKLSNGEPEAANATVANEPGQAALLLPGSPTTA